MMDTEPPRLPSIKQLLKQLSDQGYAINWQRLASLSMGPTAAWYQHVLLGIGVVAIFFCFLLLLGEIGFFNVGSSEQSLWALGLIITAIVGYWYVVGKQQYRKKHHQKHASRLSVIFVTQLTFLLMITGEGVLLFHLCRYFDVVSTWQVALLAAAMMVLTLPLYPVMLLRLLSLTFVLFFAQFSLPIIWQSATGSYWVTTDGHFLLLLAGLVWLSFSSRWPAWRYLRYAFAAVIIMRLSFSPGLLADMVDIFTKIASHMLNSDLGAKLDYPALIIAVVLCACVLDLAGQQRRFYGVWLLCGVLLGLAYVVPATVFFAVLLMVLGYATHDKVMTGLGLALLPYYLFKYYYDLQWSLLDKSFLLMASGGLLLLLALAVNYIPPPDISEQKS